MLIGGFTPLIATWLISISGGQAWIISLFLAVIAAASIICLLFIKETRGNDLERIEPDNQLSA